ncbi:dihydroorotase [Natrialbaceae archaeon A-CW1-1]
MSEVNLRVKNAKVVTPNGTIHGGVAVQDGQIVEVTASGSLPSAVKTIDADGQYIIPGFICVHNHIGPVHPEREYQDFYKESMLTETRACVHGGVTTIVPFLEQPDPIIPDLEFFIETGESQSFIDFSFHAMMFGEQHFNEIEQLAEKGIRSFKVFFNQYKNSAPELGVNHVNAGQLYKILKKTSSIPGAVVMVHAENDDLGPIKEEEIQDEGRDSLQAWADSSPPIRQAMQIEQIGMLTEHTGATSYVVHNSMDAAVDALERYKQRGVKIYGETLPNFLANHCEDESLGTWGKISPPIGYKKDQEALWKGLRSGALQHVATDHAPFPFESKGPRDSGVWEAPPGDQGLQTFLPLMLSEGVNKDRITMEQMVEVCSTNNAKRFGLYPRKGAIIEGADADLVLVDLDREITVNEEWLQGGEQRWTSSFGRTLTGGPTHIIQNGELAVEYDNLLVDPGGSSFLPRHGEGVTLG